MMTIGTVLIISGIICIVLSVFLWIVFFLPARNMFRKRTDKLVSEYSCEDQEIK